MKQSSGAVGTKQRRSPESSRRSGALAFVPGFQPYSAQSWESGDNSDRRDDPGAAAIWTPPIRTPVQRESRSSWTPANFSPPRVVVHDTSDPGAYMYKDH
ncbi:hypothetical protein [Paenibacillus sp. YPG26]|uniref:hypothetical protein n=1 Tax=Paenibacillus sp. YPG26 TaxID=2878915 RepID=UPI00203C2A75|nr:hypothetical protein [Paenibacillus sp. YPG26]USB32483.1 hypothetical protein LDO05_14420 [Paenibacillus sp. YPG26]